MEPDKIINQSWNIILEYGPKVIGAIVVWIIGTWIIKVLTRGFINILDRNEIDESLKPFLRGLVEALLKIMLVISVFSMLGIQMTSFIAVLGAAGLAVGMALSGTLQNFAGGVMILIFKPFKIGDVIEAQGFTGRVSEIQIFNTILKTADNKTIIIPNGKLSNSSMTNYTTEEKRQASWKFGIGHEDDVDKAKDLMRKLCDEDPRILKEPKTFIAISELASSSINFALRVWVLSSDYWDVLYDMDEKVFKAFKKEGLSIPTFIKMDKMP